MAPTLNHHPKTPLEAPFFLSKTSNKGNIYYHYTSYDRFCRIRRDFVLQASNKDEFGNPRSSLTRIYVTDVAPHELRRHPLVGLQKIFGKSQYHSAASKIQYCMALNMSGLPVIGSIQQPHVFYIENFAFLSLAKTHAGKQWGHLVRHASTGAF
jgi:hypothetical protein